MKRVLFTAAMIAATTTSLGAQEAMPSFSGITTSPTQAPGVWYTDRFAPASFGTIAAFQGRTNVLQIGISNAERLDNRPGPFQSQFYNTQGRKYDVGTTGPFTISADLWVAATWQSAANGLRRTDMWGTAVDNTNAVSAYPILGFTNEGGVGRFRGWDGNFWNDFNATVNYGAWNSLQIKYANNVFTYALNGAAAGSINAGATTGLGNVIMQARNFDPSETGYNSQLAEYDAHWSNSVVPEPSTYALTAVGLAGLLAVQRRRRRA